MISIKQPSAAGLSAALTLSANSTCVTTVETALDLLTVLCRSTVPTIQVTGDLTHQVKTGVVSVVTTPTTTLHLYWTKLLTMSLSIPDILFQWLDGRLADFSKNWLTSDVDTLLQKLWSAYDTLGKKPASIDLQQATGHRRAPTAMAPLSVSINEGEAEQWPYGGVILGRPGFSNEANYVVKWDGSNWTIYDTSTETILATGPDTADDADGTYLGEGVTAEVSGFAMTGEFYAGALAAATTINVDSVTD